MIDADVVGGLALILMGVSTVFGAWIGASYAKHHHLCVACETHIVDQCGDVCGPCESSAYGPMTDDELARGINALQVHLERRRGERS